jgi:hypothetical protein
LPVAIGNIVFILINGYRILQGQGRYFLEEWYGYLVPTVIFSDIESMTGKFRQQPRHVN